MGAESTKSIKDTKHVQYLAEHHTEHHDDGQDDTDLVPQGVWWKVTPSRHTIVCMTTDYCSSEMR